MPEYDNELRGVLFVNKKGDNPNRPHFRGNITIGGVEYRLSAWKRQAKTSGEQFLSLSATAPEAATQPRVQDNYFGASTDEDNVDMFAFDS